MEQLSKILERLAVAILLVSGIGMLLAMFLGTADVVGTQFLGSPVHGVTEMTESSMVLIVFGALAYAQIRRAHIRVELVYAHAGPRAQAAMDVFADIAGIIFFGLLTWQAIIEGITSWNIREIADGLIQFPLYPARWILVAGAGLLIAQLMVDLVGDLARIKSGEEAQFGTDIADLAELRGLEADEEVLKR
jgi:TRAP-type C4-dicarboxylate transport system permease small subunit